MSVMQCMRSAFDEEADAAKIARINSVCANGEWMCPMCIHDPTGMIKTTAVKIGDIIAQNPKVVSCIINHELVALANDIKLNKRERIVKGMKVNNTTLTNYDDSMGLVVDKLPIHNPAKVILAIRERILSSEHRSTCQTCCADVEDRNIVSPCGNCDNHICKKCRENWFSQVIVGEVVSKTHTKCPYCKATPKHASIKGLPISHLRNIRRRKDSHVELCEWDSRTIYAVCQSCLYVQPALARECAAAIPEVKNFVCEECRDKERRSNSSSLLDQAQDAEPTKPCPGCTTATIKNGGCNHITCPVPTCGAHWCWTCGAGSAGDVPFNSGSIYNHMARCGGIFSGDPVERGNVDDPFAYESDEEED